MRLIRRHPHGSKELTFPPAFVLAGIFINEIHIYFLLLCSFNGTKQREVAIESILWRGIVFPGHEACRMFSQDSRWHLEGTAVFSHEQQPCRLDYRITCNAAWRTFSTTVEGWLGHTLIDIRIRADTDGQWWLNEVEQPAVRGCTDIDLNFSPSTNSLPIRRLELALGEAAEVKAAWLRFPSFKLEPLLQQYRRLDETTYRYESAGGKFVADLKVNRAGFVVDYPELWKAENSILPP